LFSQTIVRPSSPIFFIKRHFHHFINGICIVYFAQILFKTFTLRSVAGAGIALTLALHLYLKYIPVFSSCGYAPLLHGEKRKIAKSIVISPRGIR
jgi:hypothetical protein